MNTHALKPDDRVRVTTRSLARVCQPGDKATIFSGPHRSPGGGWRFDVTMDEDTPDDPPILFLAQEIEPDK
jgi:hypothetical protein